MFLQFFPTLTSGALIGSTSSIAALCNNKTAKWRFQVRVLSSVTAFVLGVLSSVQEGVASPGDVCHQLQLYWIISIGVEMGVKSTSSFLPAHWTGWGGCLFIPAQVCRERLCGLFCVSQRAQTQSVVPMRMDGLHYGRFLPLTERTCIKLPWRYKKILGEWWRE